MRAFVCVLFVLAFSCSQEDNSMFLSGIHKTAKLHAVDEKLPETVPGDWLYEHKENGQTFESYKLAKPVTPTKNQNKIYIQPIGSMVDEQDSLVKYTSEYLQLFFGLEVRILNPIEDSLITSNNRRRIDDGHEQYLTKFILDSLLEKNIPEDAIVVMAITAMDLYPQDSWNFVFGQAYTKRRIGISSMYRFYENEKDVALCLKRLIKTSSHEIGHMFSILHCTHALCVMNGTNHLEETDSKPNRLCCECLSKLYWNLRFDLIRRQEGLLSFFAKHKLEYDYNLCSKDLELIKNNQ